MRDLLWAVKQIAQEGSTLCSVPGDLVEAPTLCSGPDCTGETYFVQ